MIKLRKYQEDLKQSILTAWNDGFKNVLARSPTGSGKCLGKGTPVLLFNGDVKPVEMIKVGDLLMGPDSTPRRVKSICKGESELFKITPVKGDSWVCNDAHILSLRHTQTGKILDINIKDYLTKSNDFKHLHKQFRTGIEFGPQLKELPIEPYFIGLYLAEGAYLHSCVTTPDTEIKLYLEEWCLKNNLNMRHATGRGCVTYHFSSYDRRHGRNPVSNFRKKYLSKDDRVIPQDYLTASRENRLELLAGLLDGDGHLGTNCFNITTKYPSLNNAILFLARSLGFAAYSSKVTKGIKSSGFKGEYFSISISGDTNLIPTKIKRKQATPRLQKKNVLNTGFKVESIGHGEYYGFEITGDRRFLLGDFTVTHNTVLFSAMAEILSVSHKMPVAIIVHRKELVSQISLTLASFGMYHNIIASRPTIKGIIAEQRKKFKKQFYSYKSDVTVISVDTLNARIDQHKVWANTVRVWVCDEAAHLLKDNKWGKCVQFFPNAIGLGVTATPERLDRRGLGTHAKGVFDTMVHGPEVRWLIDEGYLAKYKMAFPKSDYETYLRKAASDHDFTKEAMAQAAAESHIVGDVVENYIKFAKDKQAIVFASDMVSAERMEQSFTQSNITAKLLTGLTPDAERIRSMDLYREGKIKVLINIDLFDEGLDVPGIEVVIMARPTMSLGKYLQICGRVLRPVYASGYDLSTKEGRLAAQAAGGKPFGLIIDHVGNRKRHGLPCELRHWTLDDIVKKRSSEALVRICSNFMCNAPYDRFKTVCPFCGTEAIPTRAGGGGGSRIPPSQVDGDLVLLDPETIRELEGKAILEDPGSVAERVAKAAGEAAGQRALKNQQIRITTQKKLIDRIAYWAGVQRTRYNLTDREIHKKFYIDFGATISEVLGSTTLEMEKYMEDL